MGKSGAELFIITEGARDECMSPFAKMNQRALRNSEHEGRGSTQSWLPQHPSLTTPPLTRAPRGRVLLKTEVRLVSEHCGLTA